MCVYACALPCVLSVKEAGNVVFKHETLLYEMWSLNRLRLLWTEFKNFFTLQLVRAHSTRWVLQGIVCVCLYSSKFVISKFFINGERCSILTLPQCHYSFHRALAVVFVFLWNNTGLLSELCTTLYAVTVALFGWRMLVVWISSSFYHVFGFRTHHPKLSVVKIVISVKLLFYPDMSCTMHKTMNEKGILVLELHAVLYYCTESCTVQGLAHDLRGTSKMDSLFQSLLCCCCCFFCTNTGDRQRCTSLTTR